MVSKHFKFFAFILIVGLIRCTLSKECYNCEGINCLRASRINNKSTCADSLDNCVTVFEKSTIIARGCYSTLSQEHRSKCNGMSDSLCHICYKSLCNDKGAISCLQCNSADNADCSSAAANIKASRCPASTSTNIYCFTRNSSAKIERGCLTDTKEQIKCLDDISCEMCIADGEDTCNRDSTKDIQSSCKHATASYALLLAIWFNLMFP